MNNCLDHILEVTDLCFEYPAKKVLKNINFSLNFGEIVGLLGPNGAGKTTIFRLLAGFFKLQTGMLRSRGEVVAQKGTFSKAAFRSQIGVVFQESSLDSKVSAFQNLYFSGALYGVLRHELASRVNEALQFAGLFEQAKLNCKKFSGGSKRRLELARAMIHRPSLLLLDEPTNGLDEVWRRKFWRDLDNRRKKGMSVLLSTHRIDEAENCDRLLVMHNGEIIENSTPEKLKANIKGDTISMKTSIRIDEPEITRWAERLPEKFPELAFSTIGHEIKVVAEQGHSLVPRLVEFLPNGFLDSVNVSRPTLSDAYLHITGSSLEKG